MGSLQSSMQLWRRKFKRNLQDYGLVVALSKSFAYLFKFGCERVTYRLYKIEFSETSTEHPAELERALAHDRAVKRREALAEGGLDADACLGLPHESVAERPDVHARRAVRRRAGERAAAHPRHPRARPEGRAPPRAGELVAHAWDSAHEAILADELKPVFMADAQVTA